MFKWNHKIYMDDVVRKDPIKYRRIIERRKVTKNCYCITMPANEMNSMDIYSSRELWFKYRRLQGLEILGLASNKTNAIELVQQIIDDVYKEKHDVNAETLHEFFSKSGG